MHGQNHIKNKLCFENGGRRLFRNVVAFYYIMSHPRRHISVDIIAKIALSLFFSFLFHAKFVISISVIQFNICYMLQL